jgi:predicted DNA-binding ribbon-helix-helix protein
MRSKKVVRMEVDRATYERLKHLADRRSITLKALLGEAVRSYVNRDEGQSEEDSIFRIVGRLKLEGRNWSEGKDWKP